MPDPIVPAVESPAPSEAEVAPASKRKFRWWIPVVIVVPVLVLSSAGVWLGMNTQFLADQATVWSYESTPIIDEYVDDSTMTDHALFLFAASKPRIAADSEFNDICGSREGHDGTLGCYTTDKKRIVLFEIADARLAGLQEAVATHEMLHAAWDRLGRGEREKLSTLLDAEYKRLANDEDAQAQFDAYDFDDDAVRYDELHSLIGTEITGISKELEVYYAQYFDDRAALVDLYLSAHNVLVEIGEQVDALNDALDALDVEIEADKASYDSGWDSLNADWDAFEARNNAYFYTSQRAFDADRNALLDRGASLDTLYDQINAKVDDYNAKLAELTELDERAAELFESINIDLKSVD